MERVAARVALNLHSKACPEQHPQSFRGDAPEIRGQFMRWPCRRNMMKYQTPDLQQFYHLQRRYPRHREVLQERMRKNCTEFLVGEMLREPMSIADDIGVRVFVIAKSDVLVVKIPLLCLRA